MFRIVCCDDSDADLLQLTGYLSELEEHYPIQIFTYTNGIDLIKDYQKKQFYDLLILDMRMNEMNGIEVAEEIRKVDDSLPILIVTATIDYAVEGYRVNAFRYLVKPVVKEDFLNAVKNTLDHLFSPLLKKRQSIHHIYVNHADSVMVSESTIYRLVDYQLFEARNMDLPRKVRYAPRKKKKIFKVDKTCRLNRTYTDYLNFRKENPDVPVTQMDSVEGKRAVRFCLPSTLSKQNACSPS